MNGLPALRYLDDSNQPNGDVFAAAVEEPEIDHSREAVPETSVADGVNGCLDRTRVGVRDSSGPASTPVNAAVVFEVPRGRAAVHVTDSNLYVNRLVEDKAVIDVKTQIVLALRVVGAAGDVYLIAATVLEHPRKCRRVARQGTVEDQVLVQEPFHIVDREPACGPCRRDVVRPAHRPNTLRYGHIGLVSQIRVFGTKRGTRLSESREGLGGIRDAGAEDLVRPAAKRGEVGLVHEIRLPAVEELLVFALALGQDLRMHGEILAVKRCRPEEVEPERLKIRFAPAVPGFSLVLRNQNRRRVRGNEFLLHRIVVTAAGKGPHPPAGDPTIAQRAPAQTPRFGKGVAHIREVEDELLEGERRFVGSHDFPDVVADLLPGRFVAASLLVGLRQPEGLTGHERAHANVLDPWIPSVALAERGNEFLVGLLERCLERVDHAVCAGDVHPVGYRFRVPVDHVEPAAFAGLGKCRELLVHG